ncbi:MAG: hypothetical protein JSS35_11855 [Proteobacteria bacterium]|nr:hypothetical protein [Pseudomonadota bacterium]
MAALKLCATRDYAAEQRGRIALSERLARAINQRNFEAVTVKADDPVNAITIVFKTSQQAARTVRELQEGSPRVFVLNARIGQREVVVLPHCVLPEEVEPLESRLLQSIAVAVGEA